MTDKCCQAKTEAFLFRLNRSLTHALTTIKTHHFKYAIIQLLVKDAAAALPSLCYLLLGPTVITCQINNGGFYASGEAELSIASYIYQQNRTKKAFNFSPYEKTPPPSTKTRLWEGVHADKILSDRDRVV